MPDSLWSMSARELQGNNHRNYTLFSKENHNVTSTKGKYKTEMSKISSDCDKQIKGNQVIYAIKQDPTLPMSNTVAWWDHPKVLQP